MSEMKRKQLYITDEQEKLLKAKSFETGKTEAELVREALDSQLYTVEYLKSPLENWQEELKFIKMRGKKIKADQEKRTWRRDELYDR